MEPPHLQISLFSPGLQGCRLDSRRLGNRPELASQRAVVQASVERVRQEQLRPLIPSVVMEGQTAPAAPLTAESLAADQTTARSSTAAVST